MNKLIPFLAAIILIFAFLFIDSGENAVAQTNISPDAIAIRVMPNNEHYSAQSWYKKKNFSGSPQNLTVDGYEAVRDGRTVYVNAANVEGSLFTNIYIISYNQEAERPTMDIFGQVLSRWKFNNNLLAQGHCRIASSTACLMDDECRMGDFCDSMKARVVRDTLRLADIAGINEMLDKYYLRGYYPKLNSGSYLANRTMSVWPSWQDNLAGELGTTLALDPINRLGDCPNYDAITCWNEYTKSFVSTWPGLPTNSIVYNYTSNPDGTSASVCTQLESGLAVSGVVPCTLVGCLDFDGDGFGNPGNAACSAGSPLTDCNDLDPGIQAPIGPENTAALCGNTIDDDCDGLADCADPECAATGPCSSTCGDFVCNGVASCPPCTVLEDPDCAGSCCGDGTCNAGECGTCLVDCFCGNGTIECGEACDGGAMCSASCTIIAACTDFDHDFYIEENTAVGSCGNVCGPANNQPCLGNNDSAANNCSDSDSDRFPGNPNEVCDGKDNDCDGSIDENDTLETCQPLCTGSGYSWAGNGLPNHNCCGNDAAFFEPPALADYQTNEFGPLAKCSDFIDNDCDGFCDTANNDCWVGSQGDGECSGGCSNTAENDHTGVSVGCDQCGNSVDDDNDQTVPAVGILTTEADWGIFVGMIDSCDPDCGPSVTAVEWDDYEDSNEITCDDGVDNDCDGDLDCADGDCTGNPVCCTDDCVSGSEGCVDDNNEWTCGEAGDGDTCNEQLTAACLVTETCVVGVGHCESTCVDKDGDGHDFDNGICGTGDDCNDDSLDPAAKFMWNGNPETCDNIDNDCDGTIDDGCDNDNDNYCDFNYPIYYSGNPFGPPITECVNTTNDSAAGVSTATNDCDDDGPNAADRYPGNAEDCNGIDNDCDLIVDNNLPPAPLNSNQNGVCSGSTQLCSGVGGWIDDYTAVVGYQAPESSCGDGNDNDCDTLPDMADPDCVPDCDFDFPLPCTLP